MRVELLAGNNIKKRIKMIAAAGKLSRTKGDVFEVLDSCEVYEKNLGLVKAILGMGHKSIMEHDYFVFAIGDVTPIIEQTIIGYRLTSFTIKSGRETNFKSAGHYTPTFKDKDNNLVANQQELVDRYNSHMDMLFDEYENYINKGVKEEDARFVLPYSFLTNIIMGCNAHELERMINEFLYGKLSKIDEIKKFGEELLKIVSSKAPYLTPHINGNGYQLDDWYDKYRIGGDIKTYDKVRLVSSTPHIDEKIILSTIMYHEQVTEEQAKKILKRMQKSNPNIMAELMNEIKYSNEQRELEQVNFQFEIPISLIVLKHLTRHRMHSLLVPSFVPMWDLSNYQTPPSIKKIDLEHYQELQKINLEEYQYFKSLGIRDEDLIYFYLCGTFTNVVTTMNGRSLEWISRMRCCNKAQWEIRNIANEMVRQVKEVAPVYGTCLGASCEAFLTCPEGRESCGKVKVLRGEK